MINTGRYASSPLIYIFSCELERRSQVCAVVRFQLLCFFPSFSEDAPAVFSSSLPLPPFCRLYCPSPPAPPRRVSPYLIFIFLPRTCSRIHISRSIAAAKYLSSRCVCDKGAPRSLVASSCAVTAAPPGHPSHTPSRMDLRFNLTSAAPQTIPRNFSAFFLLARACLTA